MNLIDIYHKVMYGCYLFSTEIAVTLAIFGLLSIVVLIPYRGTVLQKISTCLLTTIAVIAIIWYVMYMYYIIQGGRNGYFPSIGW